MAIASYSVAYHEMLANRNVIMSEVKKQYQRNINNLIVDVYSQIP